MQWVFYFYIKKTGLFTKLCGRNLASLIFQFKGGKTSTQYWKFYDISVIQSYNVL